MIMECCDSKTQEAEAAGFQVQGQSELHSKTLSQNTRNQHHQQQQKTHKIKLSKSIYKQSSIRSTKETSVRRHA